MGHILMIEFDDRDTAVFDEIMQALEKHPSFEQFRLRDESTLPLPELDIFLQRRKAYSGYTEIPLTAKEFDILCMLAANKEIVLTYDQILLGFPIWWYVALTIINSLLESYDFPVRRSYCSPSPAAGSEKSWTD